MYTLRLLVIFVMIGLPIILAAYSTARFKTNWKIFWIGGGVFLLSQIGHIPFNYFSGLLLNKTELGYLPQFYRTIINALFLGLSAGLWEETARYAAFRWWMGNVRSWRKGILLGLGHGGLESIIVGLLVLYTFIQMVAIKNVDINTLVPSDQVSTTIDSISSYWATPWYYVILGGLERILTLPVQLALSIIVAQVFIQGKKRWFWIAIFYHMVVDAVAVLLISFYNVFITEIAIAIFSIISVWIIFKLKTPEPDYQAPQQNPLIEKSNDKVDQKISDREESNENLDATKYQ